VEEFVSLTDLAPTFLAVAGVGIPRDMTGTSFWDVATGSSAKSSRDHVFLERERHANVRKGDFSYPIRGIRTKEYLLLLNLRPDRWPAGDPTVHFAVGDYGDVDGSPAKEVILQRKDEPKMKRFYQLNFGKRPAVELYDLQKDPAQLDNVSDVPEYASIRAELTWQLQQWMKETNDPRVDPGYDGWDKFPYYGGRAKTGKAK
jgi:arylsulfatase A-like enzyme